jgi:ATP-dependent Clp protease ATP-binding subunit ClpX
LSIEREIANPSGIAPKCSFCDESATAARALIAGPNDVFICSECVALCQDVLSEGRSNDM